MRDLRIISINVHNGVPEGLSLSPHNERREAVLDVAAFLTDEDADIVLVQEVRNDAPGARPGGVPRQFDLLREAAGATGAAYGLTMASGAGDEYGICILARNGVQLVRPVSAILPYAGGRERRIVLIAQALVDGEPLVVANLHLDHTGMDRRAQLSELERIFRGLLRHRRIRVADSDATYRMAGNYDGPVVMGGDFNDAAESIARHLAATEMINVVDGLDADHPMRRDTHVIGGRIDHLLLSRGVQLLDQQILRVPPRLLGEGTGVTDHLAVVADVRIVATVDEAGGNGAGSSQLATSSAQT